MIIHSSKWLFPLPCHRRAADSSLACHPHKEELQKLKKIARGLVSDEQTRYFAIIRLVCFSRLHIEKWKFWISKAWRCFLRFKWKNGFSKNGFPGIMILPEQNAGYSFGKYWEIPELPSYIGFFRVLDLTG